MEWRETCWGEKEDKGWFLEERMDGWMDGTIGGGVEDCAAAEAPLSHADEGSI